MFIINTLSLCTLQYIYLSNWGQTISQASEAGCRETEWKNSNQAKQLKKCIQQCGIKTPLTTQKHYVAIEAVYLS